MTRYQCENIVESDDQAL